MELINPTAPKPRYEEEKYEKSMGSDIEESSKQPVHKRETIWQTLNLCIYSKI